MREVHARGLGFGTGVLQVDANRCDTEVRRLDVAEGGHVFIPRRHLQCARCLAGPSRCRCGARRGSDRRGGWWRRQLDFLDIHRHRFDLDLGTGALHGLAVFFHRSEVQVLLDHDAATGEQQRDALGIGLEQPGQVGFDLFELRAGEQLAGKGNLVEAHGLLLVALAGGDGHAVVW